ncbi:hypothetical protein WJX82_004293 [Trebouxia sp. C0006]
MQLLDKGFMMTKSERKAVLLKVLREYANPLPLKQQSITPKTLIEAVKQSGAVYLNGATWSFGLKKDLPKRLPYGRYRALAQMERQTTFIKVWSSNQLTHPKITLVEFWEELEHSWRLPNMQDSYTAGKGMELLRQAIEHWAPRPHVVKYLVRKECTDIVKGTKQAGKRKASAMNGFLPSHSHFPDAAASVSQLDEQPESSTMPSSANSDLNAEAYAAPLAACSAGQQGSTEQVSFVEVSVNGQVCSIHPRDAVQCRAAAVPHQMPAVKKEVAETAVNKEVAETAVKKEVVETAVKKEVAETAAVSLSNASPGTRGGGSVRSGSHQKQEDKEAEAVSIRTRAQTRAQASRAVMQGHQRKRAETGQTPSGALQRKRAKTGQTVEEPFAMPRYAVTVKEESVSRFQEHWRRYMYPPDTLRRVQWTGDPVIARAQRSSPSPHSELGSAAAQTSTHVNKEHKDGRGGTSALQLLHACKLGNYKVAEHLARLAAVVTMKSYKSDASRNVMMERDSEGVSCLHAIAQSPCLDPKDTNLMVSDILWTAGGAELIHDRTRWGLHAMHYAAGNLGQGCPVLNEMIKLSSHQDFGGILECKDARGCTPLHWAAKVGNANAITLLLNAGADPNAQDHAQASPLHYAAVSPTAYRLKCITAMLAVPVQTQADVTAKDINGQTPMHWLAGACHLSAHLEAMKLLMESGADVCAADSLGNSPLHNAAASSSLPATASLLLAHGADAQAVNVYGDTALHTAAGFGNIALLECLTEETQKRDSLAAALSCTNKAGYTPLQLAVLVGWREPVQSASRFRSQLHLRFSNTVSGPNRLLRVRMVGLFRIASSAGGREKAVPNAVDFVFPRRPAGLDPRPQSSFISSESQSLILAFGMHWAKSQGASQAALFDALRSCLWAEKAEEAPSRWRLQHRHDDQEFLCANVLQSFLPVSYTWQAEAADKFQSDGRTTAGGVVSDHSAGCQDSWADHPQGLSNAAWWHVYANAHRVQQVLTDEQRMHQLDLAAFFRHMCQRCHLACTIFRDEGSAFTVLGSLQLETPVMDRIRTGLLPLLLAHQEPFAERWNLWEVEFGSSLFEELFIHCKQIMQPADTGSKLSVLEFYLNTVTHDRPNDISKAAAVNDKEEAKGHHSTEVETLQSLDDLCRFLMLMPDREWIDLALHFCHLEQDPSQRLAFFGCLEALQVFLWLTEATADSKESRWNCIREKLQHKVCQSQDQMQQSQQQQQQQQQQEQEQEQGGTPVPGLGLQAGLAQQPAAAGPSMPTPAHLGLQAAKLTDTEKTRFKAELSRSDFLRQGNKDLVKYLLLRAEDTLLWASISWSQLQVDQILPDQPYARSSGTLWQQAVLDRPSPTDPETCSVRRHGRVLLRSKLLKIHANERRYNGTLKC